MSVESPNYYAALAAAFAVYDELFPNHKRNALMIGKLTFVILKALDVRTMPVAYPQTVNEPLMGECDPSLPRPL